MIYFIFMCLLYFVFLLFFRFQRNSTHATSVEIFQSKFQVKIKMAESSPRVKELAMSVSKFALNMYEKLSEEKSSENLFLSPYSIAVALSMTLAGAKGNTLKQMLDVMNIEKSIENNLHEIQEEYISLLEKVQDGFMLSTANRLYVNKNFPILAEFLQLVSKMYHSKSENVDFGNSGKVTKEINDWVSEENTQKSERSYSRWNAE